MLKDTKCVKNVKFHLFFYSFENRILLFMSFVILDNQKQLKQTSTEKSIGNVCRIGESMAHTCN